MATTIVQSCGLNWLNEDEAADLAELGLGFAGEKPYVQAVKELCEYVDGLLEAMRLETQETVADWYRPLGY